MLLSLKCIQWHLLSQPLSSYANSIASTIEHYNHCPFRFSTFTTLHPSSTKNYLQPPSTKQRHCVTFLATLWSNTNIDKKKRWVLTVMRNFRYDVVVVILGLAFGSWFFFICRNWTRYQMVYNTHIVTYHA